MTAGVMQVHLRYFASIREALGVEGEAVTIATTSVVQDVRDALTARGHAYAECLSAERPVRMAINHVLCHAQAALVDGDEVAFFPPVTGG